MPIICPNCSFVIHRSRPITYIDKDGYRYVQGRLEHRVVYEEAYNCSLLPWADVHHINGDKQDNRIENLEGMTHHSHGFLSATKQHINSKCHYSKCYFCGIGKTKRKGYNKKGGGWTGYRYLCRAPWDSNCGVCWPCLVKYRIRLKGLEHKKKYIALIKPMIKLEKLICYSNKVAM